MGTWRRTRDRGANMLEYVGIVLIVAGVIVGLAMVMPNLGTGLSSAVCTVIGGEDCESTDTTAKDPGSPPPSTPGDDGGPQASGDPDPSPSPGPSPTPPPEEEEKAEAKRDTEAVLNETQIGRDAMKWIEDNDVTVVYWDGQGSYYDGGSNTIYINRNQSPEEMANTFVHEANHARNRGEPDPEDMEKDEYVDAAINEEARGVVEEIRNNQQLQDARGGNVPDTGLQAEYEKAYQDAIDAENKARQQNQRPPLTPEQERELGEKAGLERVEEAFHNGEVITSTDGKTYPEYYADGWEDANESCFLWVFC